MAGLGPRSAANGWAAAELLSSFFNSVAGLADVASTAVLAASDDAQLLAGPRLTQRTSSATSRPLERLRLLRRLRGGLQHSLRIARLACRLQRAAIQPTADAGPGPMAAGGVHRRHRATWLSPRGLDQDFPRAPDAPGLIARQGENDANDVSRTRGASWAGGHPGRARPARSAGYRHRSERVRRVRADPEGRR